MKRVVKCSDTQLTDEEIKDRISREVLTSAKISDSAAETALRRILFYDKNQIDWQDAWQQIIYQMPELGPKVK